MNFKINVRGNSQQGYNWEIVFGGETFRQSGSMGWVVLADSYGLPIMYATYEEGYDAGCAALAEALQKLFKETV